MDDNSTKPKISKAEAEYGPSSSPAEHRCGICEYFYSIGKEPGHGHGCEKVEGEDIQKMYGCKLFRRDLVKAANDRVTISEHPPTASQSGMRTT